MMTRRPFSRRVSVNLIFGTVGAAVGGDVCAPAIAAQASRMKIFIRSFLRETFILVQGGVSHRADAGINLRVLLFSNIYAGPVESDAAGPRTRNLSDSITCEPLRE